ncbi:hypothetical protein KF840_14510 [bacterium]|nr:hypothetical protein [bacterium]
MSRRVRSSGLAALLVAFVTCGAATAGGDGAFVICKKQRYALCATARCLVYNQVAYCACDVKFGDSISLPFTLAEGDACAVDKKGFGNGYMLSTYSLPSSVRAGGTQALYTCPGDTADGAYAQCDGGFCFTSTSGRRFPGFARKLKANQVMCSCPISVAAPGAGPGFQIVGPYPCQQEFFANCYSDVANTDTGSSIYVGAPTGTPRLLTRALYGSVPPLNHCEMAP